jgi:TolB-like protein
MKSMRTYMKHENVTITVDLVREELTFILNSDDFRNSPVLAKFLEFVVLEKIFLRDEEIKEYTIGVKALGRPPDFNPQIDPIVRIHAGRVRMALFHFYNTEGKFHKIVIDIPKGSYVPSFSLRDSEKTTSQTEQNFEAEFVPVSNGYAPVEGHIKPVLAVLPFTNLSSDNSKDFFVAGIGEQISTDMARFQNISVISYFSTNNHKPGSVDLKKLRKIPGLEYILMGSVRFIDSAVRVNVQLMHPENSRILWSEVYNRQYTPGNVFEIQEHISDQVLNAIADDNGILVKMNKANSSALSRPITSKVQEGIYKYYDYTLDFSPVKFTHALNALETAIDTEPKNALANGLLAGLYLDKYSTKVDKDYHLLDRAIDLARQAVLLDEKCQQAHKSLVWAHLFSGNKEVSVQHVEACISLNPKSASIVSAMGLALVCCGEYTQGYNYLVKAKELNPNIYHTCKLGLSIFYFYEDKHTESLHWLMQMQPLELPFFKLLHTAIIGKMNGKLANLDESILTLKDNSDNIISRLLMDNKIKKEISHGLRLAGLYVSFWLASILLKPSFRISGQFAETFFVTNSFI